MALTVDARRQLRDRVLVEQAGRCAICGLTQAEVRIRDTARGYRVNSAGTFVLDHDHRTGLVRGVLCIPCNSGLGSFDDNVRAIRTADTYLSRHRSQPTDIQY